MQTRTGPEKAIIRAPRRSLDRITRHWQRLGAEDPLWAVYVAPDTRDGGWDNDAFFATGRSEIARVVALLASHGSPASYRVALDFGCGVGRLSQPLATVFDRVIALDVSEPMLDRGRELSAEYTNIEFVLNQRDDLRFLPDASVDLVYSSLVLQHLPRALAARYLAEFIRVLRPGGVVLAQVATRPTASLKGLAFRCLPAPVVGALQRVLLHYPAPMRMQAMPERWMRRKVAAAGGRIAAQENDSTYGGHWIYTRYLIERR